MEKIHRIDKRLSRRRDLVRESSANRFGAEILGEQIWSRNLRRTDLEQKSSANRFGERILGKQIWSRNRRLTSDGVETYSERGNGDLCPNMEAERLTNAGVVIYSERGYDDLYPNTTVGAYSLLSPISPSVYSSVSLKHSILSKRTDSSVFISE